MRSWKFRSIETAVLGFFLVRLYGIWFPPLETWHSWRQTLTNMMARNMSESGYDLFYPMIDMAGERSGIIGSEFPFFQVLIAIMNDVFGYQHWYGRLISLIISSIAAWCFFHVVKRIFSERAAWFSTLVFLSSLWLSFSRKTMPDTFAVSLVIMGIYFTMRYVDQKRVFHIVLAGTLLALGGLCKIPAVFLFGLYVPFFLNENIQQELKLKVGLMIAVASAFVLLWYFYWVPYLVDTYHFELFFPKGIAEGLAELRPLLGDFFLQFYFGALRSYSALLPLLLGIIWLCYRMNRLYAIGFIVLTAIFLLFSVKTGAVFPTHNYYVLPFVPVMAVIVGLGLQRLGYRWAIALTALICIEAIGNQISDFRIKSEQRYKTDLERQIRDIVPPSDKVVLLYGANPEWMYWYHRKGWGLDRGMESDRALMNKIYGQGGRYILIDKHCFDIEGYSLYKETKDSKIYKLEPNN